MLDGPVAIVGPGRMGQGIALALKRRGIEVRLLGRRPRPLAAGLALHRGPWAQATRGTGLVLLATPDDAIAEAAARLAADGAIEARHAVLHLSGLLDRRALSALDATGAALGSFHPLQSVADPTRASELLRGAYAGVEGDPRAVAAGEALAQALEMTAVPIRPGGKPVYHAGAVLVANYTAVLLAAAERLAGEAGVPIELAQRIYRPLLTGAVANLVELGPAAALTGPVRRGDRQTVAAHLAALRPADRALYRELGRAALEVARAAGLPPELALGVAEALAVGDETFESGDSQGAG